MTHRSTDLKEAFQAFHQTLPVSGREISSWDREWIYYLNTRDPGPFLLDHTRFQLEPEVLDRVNHLSENDMLESVWCPALPEMKLWVSGKAIAGKRVCEFGCGPGLSGKQLGAVTERYLGIDYSPFALYLARLTSPPQCIYAHLSDLEDLLPYLGTMETIVCRDFFIHQNYRNAEWLLQLAHFLLKEKGMITADFFYTTRDKSGPGSLFFPAKSPLSEAASCGYVFTPQEIQDLADAHGFQIKKTRVEPALSRHFVQLVKKP